jgi:MFS family permease
VNANSLEPARAGARPALSRNVRVLGAVSFLTDVSTEMLYPVIPLYLTEVLAAPVAAVGLVEGAAEATANVLKGVSGRMADRARRRLPFLFCGYGLAALGKPLLALATSWTGVLGARIVDRTGKGLRGPARDALIVDSTDPSQRGRAFGWHRSMDTLGAALGPAVGMALLYSAGLAYTTLFWLAAIPAALGVIVLVAVREPTHARRSAASRPAAPWIPADPVMRRFLLAVAVFSIGNSSNAFLLLRARDLGWSPAGVIGLYMLFNISYAASAAPIGALSDRWGRRGVLLAGFALSAAVYAGFAVATSAWTALALLPLYGVYAGAFGSAGRALVADLAPTEHMAGALGSYQMITGLGGLVASLAAGALWTWVGPVAPFAFGATLSAGAVVVLATVRPD